MWAPATSPAGRALRPPPRLPAVVRVVVPLPATGRARRLPLPPSRPCLAAPRASEMAAAAEEGEGERRWWRGAEEMDAAVRRELAIRRLQEEAEEAGTGRSRREFAVFETARGDTLFTQSWTPAAAGPVRGSTSLLHSIPSSRPIPAQSGPRLSMTQGPTSLLPVWARTTARRPSTRRQSLHATTADAMEGEDAHHRPSSSSSSGRPFLSGLCAAALRRKPISARASAAASGEGLVRQLGVLELVLLGIGASIGAGIFVITGTVARDAGPGVTISFALAGAACVLNALCYAELASRFPAVVGGAYLYTYAAFNELTAFLVFTQLMLDYHIGAASIARSLASYFIQFLELIPSVKGNVPSWIGHGEEFFGGVVSVNILAPILLVILTVILCRGVKESSAVNTFMTTLKIIIVIVVVFAGVFEVDVSNWSPFMPNGFKAVVTGSTVVFFAYVGFDAVANSAEEAKRPQRDLPIGILGSLLACVILYVAVCLVITGMLPYTLLGEDAPLAEAFSAKGLKFVTVLISIGAVAGLTTTLLVGLYVQSRLYLGLGRDGLLPSIFSKVHPTLHTPLHSQIWVGCVAAILAGLFNVHALSHILSVGTLTGYSVVSACVITLRWSDKATNSRSFANISIWQEGVFCLVIVALCGFIAGISYRFSYSIAFIIIAFVIATIGSFSLMFRQVYVPVDPPRFSCPGVPMVPIVSVFFNMFLFAQLHEEAWYRFVILSLIAVGVYAGYGQYNAVPSTSDHSSVAYHGVPSEAP